MNQTPEYLQSELPAIELFQKQGYDYIKNHPRKSINEVILDDRLYASLTDVMHSSSQTIVFQIKILVKNLRGFQNLVGFA